MRAWRHPSDRLGAALAFVVLLMLALLTVAHGGLVAALSEVAASRAAARDLRLRGAAQSAIAQSLAAPPGPWMDSVGLWEMRAFTLEPLDSITTRGSARRLSAESWWVEGVARSPSGPVSTTRRLVWSLDPIERVTSMLGAVVTEEGAPVNLEGLVDVETPAAVTPPMDLSGCTPWQPQLEAHFAASPLQPVATLPDSGAAFGLGLLDFERLIGLATDSVTEVGTPLPQEASGACLVDEPWVWGDPDRPWTACGSYLALRGASSHLLIVGGAGQGILVIDGDVTLSAGARFYGVIVASGALRLTDASVAEGMVLSLGGVSADAGTTLRASACWAARALEAQRDVLGAFVPVSVE